MNNREKKTIKLSQLIVWALATLLFVFPQSLTGQETESIKIDGSSTVYPITQKIAEEYQNIEKKPINIKVEFSGTGGGFDKFCRGETDINNASRPIQLDEMEACNKSEIRYIELPIAFDALTVVVNPQNDWIVKYYR